MTQYKIDTHRKVCPAEHPRRIKWLVTIIILFIILILCLTFCVIGPLGQRTWAWDIFGINRYNINTGTHYIVYTEATGTERDAVKEEAERIKARGGAGNIVEREKFYIVLNAYQSQEKADSVVVNLSAQNITAKVYALDTKQLNIRTYDSTNREILISNNDFLKNLIINLEDCITQFDSYMMSANKLQININRIKLNCQQELQKLSSLPDFEQDEFYTRMVTVSSIVEVMCDKDYNATTVSAISCEIKNNLINIIFALAQS